jgi:hypothetical protein
MIIKSYCQGKVEFSSSFCKKNKDSKQTITRYLRKYYRSIKRRQINQRPIVAAGEKMFFQGKYRRCIQEQMANYL